MTRTDARTDAPGDLAVLGADLGAGVRAAFTTRHGGGSRPPWGALHLGLDVEDDPARVRANRETVARWLGAPVAYATQVHGADVAVVASPPDPSELSVGRYDALVSTSAVVGVGVLVADCVPVLLADAEAGVVAAVHAGRRGLADGVVQAAVARLVALGARPDRLRAAVGPAVCGACYEVPAELRDEVAQLVPGTASTTSWGTPALDLPAGVAGLLRAAGVARVQLTGACTMEDDRFYSHRRAQRAGTRTGRCAGVVRISGVSP